jgi:hypothetical protein
MVCRCDLQIDYSTLKKAIYVKNPLNWMSNAKKITFSTRLTAPSTPKTNGMVERVNGKIKTNTILKNQYKDIKAMEEDVAEFLSFYNLHRRHGSLRKELKVKTPFQALQKCYQLNPKPFHQTPEEFKIILLHLPMLLSNSHLQPCEI